MPLFLSDYFIINSWLSFNHMYRFSFELLQFNIKHDTKKMKEIKFELTPSFTSNSFIPFEWAATTRPFIQWFNKMESVSVGITLISLKYMYNVLFSVFFFVETSLNISIHYRSCARASWSDVRAERNGIEWTRAAE